MAKNITFELMINGEKKGGCEGVISNEDIRLDKDTIFPINSSSEEGLCKDMEFEAAIYSNIQEIFNHFTKEVDIRYPNTEYEISIKVSQEGR